MSKNIFRAHRRAYSDAPRAAHPPRGGGRVRRGGPRRELAPPPAPGLGAAAPRGAARPGAARHVLRGTRRRERFVNPVVRQYYLCHTFA